MSVLVGPGIGVLVGVWLGLGVHVGNAVLVGVACGSDHLTVRRAAQPGPFSWVETYL